MKACECKSKFLQEYHKRENPLPAPEKKHLNPLTRSLMPGHYFPYRDWHIINKSFPSLLSTNHWRNLQLALKVQFWSPARWPKMRMSNRVGSVYSESTVKN